MKHSLCFFDPAEPVFFKILLIIIVPLTSVLLLYDEINLVPLPPPMMFYVVDIGTQYSYQMGNAIKFVGGSFFHLSLRRNSPPRSCDVCFERTELINSSLVGFFFHNAFI